jgi:four helix bundle protein
VVARRYTDLDAWKLANEVRERAERLTTARGFAQHSWLHSQLDRASHSACANIAEGFGRYKPKVFANSLRISRGSLLEVQDHLQKARNLGLIADADLKEVSHLAVALWAR